MAHWTDEFKDFRLSDDGSEYFAIGEYNNILDIDASDVIKILENIACDENDGKNKIEVLKIEHCRIKGNLDIRHTDAEKVKRVKENNWKYIKLPKIELSFLHTVFDGNVNFGSTKFEGERTSFYLAEFEGETNFSGVKFKEISIQSWLLLLKMLNNLY